jgi:hypothetical protein
VDVFASKARMMNGKVVVKRLDGVLGRCVDEKSSIDLSSQTRRIKRQCVEL